MKLSCALALFSAVVSTNAAITYFDLSPAGTDVAVGLSPSNQVPAVTNSTGSGDAISGGIAFDSDTHVLQVAIGYGSAAGFTDLTGVPSAMHIHGPAGPGTNAGVLISLVPYNFSALAPAKGGVIYGNIVVASNVVPTLLAGLTYVNIHTATNPSGEIRGQLIPVVSSNATLAVTCPSDRTVECGDDVSVTVGVSNPAGNALTVVWSLSGHPVHTNLIAAGSAAVATNVSLTGQFPPGTNVIGVAVTDSANNSASCSSTLTVVDTTPPVITALTASPSSLWPPNHKLVIVRIGATIKEACCPVRWKVTRVRSDESPDGLGDGNSSSDWQIIGDHTVSLRAERSGNGDGRVYTITVVATDAAGNHSAPKTVTVTVAHSQGK
jgi:hypothetical protein